MKRKSDSVYLLALMVTPLSSIITLAIALVSIFLNKIFKIKECTDPNAVKCGPPERSLLCRNQTYLLNEVCLDTCPSTYIHDVNSGRCVSNLFLYSGKKKF